MKRQPYRIVLADDHTMVRYGIKKMLEENPDLKVVGEASDGLALLSLLKAFPVDMVILDISMPNLRGIEALRELKRSSPHIKVLMLTMHKDYELLDYAISAGADGYALKEDSDKELYSAIGKIRCGEVYISPRLSEEVTGEWVRIRRGMSKPAMEDLTKRERQILRLIAEGKSSKEIAKLLFISVRTAEKHRSNIMDKLDITKATDLVKYYMSKGYIP